MASKQAKGDKMEAISATYAPVVREITKVLTTEIGTSSIHGINEFFNLIEDGYQSEMPIIYEGNRKFFVKIYKNNVQNNVRLIVASCHRNTGSKQKYLEVVF